MPILTISSDTRITGSSTTSHPARFGHLWYTLTDDEGVSKSFGFGQDPDFADALVAAGDFSQDGHARATPAAQYQCHCITQQQFDAMLRFGESPRDFGFGTQFNMLTHNSVDFIAAALRYAGIDIDMPAAADTGGLGWTGAIIARAAYDLDKEAPNLSLTRVAIDLDDDGIELQEINPSRPVMFNSRDNHQKNAVGWVKPDDGWLVLPDRMGQVTNGNQLLSVQGSTHFGGNTKPPLLEQLDGNGDGVLDSRDSSFKNLQVWRDLNQDGQSQEGELASLDAHGIISIRLPPTTGRGSSRPARKDGNAILSTLQFTRKNGRTGKASLVSLDVDTFKSRSLRPLEPYVLGAPVNYELIRKANTEEKKIPDLRGGGAVRDLRDAARLSSRLQHLVKDYLSRDNGKEQFALLDQILDAWADTSPRKTNRQMAGTALPAMRYVLEGVKDEDAFIRKMGVVERFMDFSYSGGGPGFSGYSQGFVRISLSSMQVKQIELAYAVFKLDLDRGLASSSRLQPHMKLFWEAGTAPEGFKPLEAQFEASIRADRHAGAGEVVDFVSAVGIDQLKAMGWDAERFVARLGEQAKNLHHGSTPDTPAPTQADHLIQAMAEFPTPGAGSTTLPTPDHSNLQPILAELWT